MVAPAVGELTYNGYTFDGTAKITVDAVPVRDDAGRTVIFRRHIIEVEAIVQEDDGTDREMLSIRQRLNQDGGELTFISKGFGDDLKVNTTDGLDDLKWGPKTEVLGWEPIGSSAACAIKWRVVANVAPCDFTPIVPGAAGVIAYNYAVVFDVSETGATTRTITGYIEIAQRRKGRKLRDTADRYRRKLKALALVGFKRTQNWSVDADKSRLNFIITDTEIESPNPYPDGSIKCTGKAKARWQRGKQGGLGFGSINMAVTLAADKPSVLAYVIFVKIAQARLNAIRNARQRTQSVLINSLEAEEDLFGRTHTFRVGYQFLTDVANLVSEAGLWQPIATDWNLWHQSLVDTTFHNRGHAKLADIPSYDAIVDLCLGQEIPTIGGGRDVPPASPRGPALAITNVQPSSKISWIAYDAHITIIEDTGDTVQTPIKAPPTDTTGSRYDQPGGPEGRDPAFPSPTVTSIVSVNTVPVYNAIFFGSAKRAGHKIPKPRLLKIGGQKANVSRTIFNQRAVGDALGLPIYAAEWHIVYSLAGPPGPVAAPVDIRSRAFS